jgi:hypothetical protein
MRQSGHYSSSDPMTKEIFLKLLEAKIENLKVSAAKEDIYRFIQNPDEIEIWSRDFFLSLLPQIQYQ